MKDLWIGALPSKIIFTKFENLSPFSIPDRPLFYTNFNEMIVLCNERIFEIFAKTSTCENEFGFLAFVTILMWCECTWLYVNIISQSF